MAARTPCDLSSASEGDEFGSRLFDMTGCDSSATDEDADYEPRPSRKRDRAPGGGGGGVVGKKVKQEATSAEDYDTLASAETDAVNLSLADTQSSLLLPNKLHCPKPQHGHSPACEGSVEPAVELTAGGSCMRGTTERAERCSSNTETMERTAGRQSEKVILLLVCFNCLMHLCVCVMLQAARASWRSCERCSVRSAAVTSR